MKQALNHIGIVIGEQCPYCQKFRSPLDIIQMPGGAKVCSPCWQRHEEAVAALSAGNFTGRCSECDKHWTELRSASGRMALHFENGLYRPMCESCDRTYVPLRRELYKGTEFAHARKLY
ncbi:MAG: hypothetical protein LAP40_16905 [Acidobacteriia bacterium]|nr:hypothetical protein [Terriglobia bacterium]